MKSRPMGCLPSQPSFSTDSSSSSDPLSTVGLTAAPCTDVMTSTLRQEFVGPRGSIREGLVDRLVVEHHRRCPGISERLPDLRGVLHVRHLDDAGRLVRELYVIRVRGE